MRAVIPDADEVSAALSAPASIWFGDALARVAAGERGAFAAAWSGGGRRLGRAAIRERWTADEAGRALLLVRHLGTLAADAQAPFVLALYEKGELREQMALMKALAFLPGPERFAEVATSAMRSNALDLIEAIACDNPYPAAHLADAAFNQLVLKAMFNGLSPRRVAGLARRRNRELARMADAWVASAAWPAERCPRTSAVVLEGEADAAL
jgi:hypothetical protein